MVKKTFYEEKIRDLKIRLLKKQDNTLTNIFNFLNAYNEDRNNIQTQIRDYETFMHQSEPETKAAGEVPEEKGDKTEK